MECESFIDFAGEQDGLITPEDRDRMAATVRRAYRLLGAEGHLDYALHPGGHFLNWDLAVAFLAKHLGPVRCAGRGSSAHQGVAYDRER